MNSSNTEQTRTRSLSPQIVSGIAFLIAFFGPMIVQSYNYGGPSSDITIVAMTWTYYSNYWMGPGGAFIVNPLMVIQSLPFSFPRLIFVYMLYRLYSGKTSQKRVLIAGIIMEIFLPVIFLISYLPMLIMNPGWFYMPILIPIPFLLLYGVALAKIFPPPEEKLWIETEKSKYWWEKKERKEQKEVPAPTQDTPSEPEDDWLKEN